MALKETFERQGFWLFRYRGVLPVIFLAAGVLVFIDSKFDPRFFAPEEPIFESLYFYACLGLSILGLLIRIYTVGHTAPNTSGRNTQELIAESLNTDGSYSLVRHPLYLGNFLIWLGPAMLSENFWFIVAFVFLFILYYERIMFAEEQHLKRKFGAAYSRWPDEVPAIIPKFKGFKRPALPFDRAKALTNEKTGILLTFLIFALLRLAGQFIQQRAAYDLFLPLCTVLAIVYYITFKSPVLRQKLLVVRKVRVPSERELIIDND